MAMTNVCIAQSAWETIMAEVSHFASLGNSEAIVYPMFGFIRAWDCTKAPWEMLELEDLEYFVVTHAHAPLREFCRHTPAHAGYTFTSDEEKDKWHSDIISWKDAIFENHPTLEIGNVHSHPFAHLWTNPSMGHRQDYGRIFSMWQHMCTRNVNSPLEIILCRSSFGKNDRWDACCFAFDKMQQPLYLGKARIVPDDDVRVKYVLSVPYWKTAEGVEWERKLQAEIPAIESFERFDFGWSSVRIRIDEWRALFIHIPPQFPDAGLWLGHIGDAEKKTWARKLFPHVPTLGYDTSFEKIISSCLESEGDNHE